MANVITHNHTIKDTIYFMHKNKVADGKIEAVQIFINKPTESSTTNHIWTKIQYSVSYKEHGENHTDTKTVYEEDAFATKQELLDSL